MTEKLFVGRKYNESLFNDLELSYYSWNSRVEFHELLGKTIVRIEVIGDGHSIKFYANDGNIYTMTHEQDCCEEVYIEDIAGNLADLLDEELIQAEETSSHDNPLNDDYSYTWTFYKLATKNGYVTIRWYGTSNGYYSESAQLYKNNAD